MQFEVISKTQYFEQIVSSILNLFRLALKERTTGDSSQQLLWQLGVQRKCLFRSEACLITNSSVLEQERDCSLLLFLHFYLHGLLISLSFITTLVLYYIIIIYCIHQFFFLNSGTLGHFLISWVPETETKEIFRFFFCQQTRLLEYGFAARYQGTIGDKAKKKERAANLELEELVDSGEKNG